MGRAKLNMELITKEKSRNITFKKRKEGLIRKMHEFSTLCDVDACIIIYGPTNENGRIEPEIWPQNLDEVKRIIGVYKSKSKDSGSKSSGLPDFFLDRSRKIEQDLARLKRKNLESKYPTWPDPFNFKSESELTALSAALTDKLKHVKSMVDLLRRNRNSTNNNNNNNSIVDFWSSQSHLNNAGPSFYAPRVGGVELDLVYQQAISSMHVHQELFQFDGATALFNRQVFYEPKNEIVDPLRPMTRYYAPPQVMPPYIHAVPEMAPPQMHFPNHA